MMTGMRRREVDTRILKRGIRGGRHQDIVEKRKGWKMDKASSYRYRRILQMKGRRGEGG